jgi:hypothetical protein
MNKRVEELAHQAGLDSFYVPEWSPWAEEFEKFAELVVRECIEQAHGVANLRGVNDDMIYGADTAAGRISKHFGVEK